MSEHESHRHGQQSSFLALPGAQPNAQKGNGSERGERSKPLNRLGRRRPRRRGGHQGRRLRASYVARSVPALDGMHIQ